MADRVGERPATDTAAATNATAQFWSDLGGDASDLPQRLFSISWAYACSVVAVGMQSVNDGIDANRAGFERRFARSRWWWLCLFNVPPLNGHVAGLSRPVPTCQCWDFVRIAL